jgi:hypothetical protein
LFLGRNGAVQEGGREQDGGEDTSAKRHAKASS